MKGKQTLAIAIGVVAIGVLAFLAGTQYQRRTAAVRQAFIGRRTFPVTERHMGDRTGWKRSGGGIIRGQVQKVEAGSVTISRPNGSTYTVNVTAQTPVMKTVAAQAGDLKAGEDVTVYGSPSATGGYTVTSVLIGQ